MNKYQEALDLKFEKTYIIDLHLEKFPEAQEALYKNEEFKENINKTEEFSNKYKQATADALQELVDQTKTPTLEQVKQEWEKLGYVCEEGASHLVLRYKGTNNMIHIWEDRTYRVDDWLTFQEHNLLTKTFRALGWEV